MNVKIEKLFSRVRFFLPNAQSTLISRLHTIFDSTASRRARAVEVATSYAKTLRDPTRQASVIQQLLVLVAFGVVATFCYISFVHRADSFNVDHVSGVWLGMAAYVNNGVLYPGVFQDGAYGGSRYMPFYFILHAALQRLSGDYIVAGKILSIGLTAACSVLVYLTLRHNKILPSIAFAVTAFGLTSTSLFLAGTTIRGDLLAVCWSLAALLVADRQRTRNGAIFAGVLCALAIASKITAGWAPLAIIAINWRQDRDFAKTFCAAWIASVAVVLVPLYVLSSGRIVDNFAVFSEPGMVKRLLWSPYRLFYFMYRCPTLLALLPLALWSFMIALSERRVSLYHWAFLWCLPVLLVIFADRGTTDNHLLDLVVLAMILGGILATQLRALSGGQPLPIILLVGLILAWPGKLGPPLKNALNYDRSAWSGKPLSGVVPDKATILSEDPRVEVTRGRLPVVLDPYALVYIERKFPERVALLLRRIDAKEFDFVVLHHRLDLDSNIDAGWYETTLGRSVSGSIRANYRFLVEQDGFTVLVPKR